MDPVQRQRLRIAAGQEVIDDLGRQAWQLTFIPGAPQSGSVGFRDQRFTHNLSDAVADGGVVITQDRQVRDSLMGLGVYNVATIAPSIGKWVNAVLSSVPLSWWRLGETGIARVAVDQMGSLPPNLLTNPNFEVDGKGFNTATASGFSSGVVAGVTSAQAFVGAQSMQLVTSGGSTNQGIWWQSPAPPVIAGLNYTFSLWVKGDVGGERVQIQITTPSGNKNGPAVTLTTAWQQISLTWLETVSGTATILGIRNPDVTARTFYIDALMMTQTSGPVAFYEGNGGNDSDYLGSFLPNLCPFPSFENNATTGWTQGGTANVATVDATQGFSGTHSLRSTSSAAGSMGFPYMNVNANHLAPVTAGSGYSASVYLKADAAYSGTWSLQLYWYDASLTNIATSASGPGVAPSTSWQRVTVSNVIAPAGAVYARIVVTRTTAAAGEAVNADAAMITASGSPQPYSDTTAVIIGQPGALGGSGDTDASVLFDGQNGYINVGITAGTQLLSGTISAWVKTTSTDLGFHMIMGREKAYGLFMENHVLTAHDWGGAVHDHQSAFVLNDGAWHHTALTWTFGVTNGTVLYGDGIAVLTTTTSLSDWTKPFTIGANGSNLQYWPGQIDEAMLHNYPLSADEVAALYKAGITP